MNEVKKLIRRASKRLQNIAIGIFELAKDILRYLRINDENNNLSLTNLVMAIMLYKVWVTQATSVQDLTALTVAILGYQAKRVITKDK